MRQCSSHEATRTELSSDPVLEDSPNDIRFELSLAVDIQVTIENTH